MYIALPSPFYPPNVSKQFHSLNIGGSQIQMGLAVEPNHIALFIGCSGLLIILTHTAKPVLSLSEEDGL